MSEAGGKDFEDAGRRVLAALARYLDESRAGEGRAVHVRPAREIARDLDLARLIREGGLAADLDAFDSFVERYLARTTRLHHPGYMCHQVAVPHGIGALGELIHGLTNNPMAMYEMGPAAATVELAVLEWMLERAGFPAPRWPGDRSHGPGTPPGAGVLTHGGSLANLTALLAARARAAPGAWEAGVEPGRLAILAPPSSHYSIARAASILGLGSRAVRPLAVDDAERIEPSALPAALDKARADGVRVMAVVANACATATGLYDPLEEVGRFCREQGLWFHVDGAHGASALASPRERARMRGVELADSLIWDAHKMLRTSALCTAVLLRDERSFDAAFHEEASYLFYGDGDDDAGGIDLIHRTVECTKAGLGLKVFFAIAALGEAGIARYVESRTDAVRRFAARIRARPGFEVPFDPETNVLCFRRGTDDARQVALRAALRREGAYHLSSATVRGRRYLRLAVMSPATDDATIEGLLAAIERLDSDPQRPVE